MQAYKKIKALGSEIEFYLQSDETHNFENDLSELETKINNFEQQFSRFKYTSELSQLNQATGKFVVSEEMMKILLLAKSFNEITGGIFDPTILKTLENHGYDKSFDSSNFNQCNQVAVKSEKINFSEIVVDVQNNSVSRPENLKIDFGGIGKGYIVDEIVKNLKNKGYKNFWVSAGGDMYLSGRDENHEAFKVGVQNPLELDKDLFNVNVSDMAVATSGIAKRRWQKNNRSVNHIIDPRTGTSVDNDLLAVTVISDKTVKSDIFAKTVLILGREAGLEFINNLENTEALIIDNQLGFSISKNINKYLTKL